MNYFCANCRRPLVERQIMCDCGQVFDAVPPYDPESVSRFWPLEAKPQMVQWWDGFSSEWKFAISGGIALALVASAIVGSVRHYRSLQSQFPSKRSYAAAETRWSAGASRSVPPYVRPQRQSVAQANNRNSPKTNEVDTSTLNSTRRETFKPADTSPAPAQAPIVVSSEPNYPIPADTQTPDATNQAEAALQDAKNAVQEANNQFNAASDAHSQNAPDWNSFKDRIMADQAAVQALRSSLPDEEYRRATTGIETNQSSLEDLHGIWDRTRGTSQITIAG